MARKPIPLSPHIQSIPEHQRPREKLCAYGSERLTDQELLAILLNTGSKDESVLDLAQRILRKDSGYFILNASVRELSEIKGIGMAKACRIVAALEFARRYLFLTPGGLPVIKEPKDAANLLQSEIGFLDREAVRTISLDAVNQVVAIDTVSLGGLSAAPVHPREVFKAPLKHSAAGIIILHNHPSGNTKPSKKDVEETRRLSIAGDILGIHVYDHIILSRGKYYSMLESGEIPETGNSTEAG